MDIPYDQFLDNNNNKNIICNQDCIPFCQCIQQNTLPITSADQNHQHPIVKAIDQQPVISEGLLHQQLVLNNKNDNMLNHSIHFALHFVCNLVMINAFIKQHYCLVMLFIPLHYLCILIHYHHLFSHNNQQHLLINKLNNNI